MKNFVYLYIGAIILSACTSEKKLDRELALKILKEQKTYPKIVDEEIYTADPEDAKKILDSGLESEGLLAVQRTQNSGDVGKPIVTFTEKAKPFLLPVTEDDKKSKIQRVKIAEEDIEEVTGIQLKDGDKQAVVEYKTSFKNITPFSKLSKVNFNSNETRKATFYLYDDGWRIDSSN
jgi:hypothetical protein